MCRASTLARLLAYVTASSCLCPANSSEHSTALAFEKYTMVGHLTRAAQSLRLHPGGVLARAAFAVNADDDNSCT